MSDPNDTSIPVLHDILVPGDPAQARHPRYAGSAFAEPPPVRHESGAVFESEVERGFVPVVEPLIEPVVERGSGSVIEPVFEPVHQPLHEPLFQPAQEPMYEPASEPVHHPVQEHAYEPMNEQRIEPAWEPAAEPGEASTFAMPQAEGQTNTFGFTQPAVEPSSEFALGHAPSVVPDFNPELSSGLATTFGPDFVPPFAPEPASEFAPEFTPQPAHQLAPEFVPEPAPEFRPEPAHQFAPEFTPEPAPQFTPEPAPQFVPEFTPEPAPQFTPEFTPEPAPQFAPEFIPEPAPQFVPEFIPDSAPSSGVFDRAEPLAPLEAGTIVPPDFEHPAPAPTPPHPALDADVIAERLRGRFANFLAGEGRGVVEARCRDALQDHTTWLVQQITREVASALETEMTGWVREAVAEELAQRSRGG